MQGPLVGGEMAGNRWGGVACGELTIKILEDVESRLGLARRHADGAAQVGHPERRTEVVGRLFLRRIRFWFVGLRRGRRFASDDHGRVLRSQKAGTRAEEG